MHEPLLSLVLAAGGFLFVLLWRVRPLAWRANRRAARQALQEARGRIDAAAEGPARARAFCEAADLAVRLRSGRGSAAALYFRAMRSDPKSVEVVKRAAAGLAHHPGTLESLLWRHLAMTSWTEAPAVAVAALDALRALYAGPLRNSVRARALAKARDALRRE